MPNQTPRVVKVRINASGKRLIGCVALPALHARISDVLNASEPCLLLTPYGPMLPNRGEGPQVVFKDAITYLEALEEPRWERLEPPGGEFRPVVAELRGPEPEQLLAEVFVPAGQTVFDVLADPRPFVSLRNVHFVNFVERYAFLALGKKQLIVVKT